MSLKTVLVAMLALVFGGSSALVVVFFSPKSNAPARPETDGIVVATMDVGRGTTITAEMVEVKQWPKSMVPAGATRKLDDVVGQTARTSIVKDEAILTAKLTAGTGLHALVPPGMRAYTIQTPTLSAGVGGFVQPEDRVDVILSVTSAATGDEKRTGGGIATVLLQNVQVLAAGPSLDTNSDAPPKMEGRQLTSVTLLVTARQAQELTLAQNKGVLNLALRRDGDTADESPPPLYLSDLPFVREDPNAQPETPTAPVEPPPPPPAPTPVAEVAPTPKKPANSQIRTYRGLNAGLVVVQSNSDATR